MANDKLWEEVRESEERSAAQLSMLLEKVQDLPSFVRFIDALSKDRKDAAARRQRRQQDLIPAGTDGKMARSAHFLNQRSLGSKTMGGATRHFWRVTIPGKPQPELSMPANTTSKRPGRTHEACHIEGRDA
ncbi:hypothetical protein [Mesorhizobium wenxiniae]|uniref:Uncharacterized protein n=1 Tax=Mesorhizobium wenxiniae TaxID=2014805 RepID=A0A271K7U6_9HYPH|nr:hypothetical protein [Mesorhizobium wenxiniae]PAP91833.1 hypothetical protein CIT31_31970 [Mesorhizobium wenxiniae]